MVNSLRKRFFSDKKRCFDIFLILLLGLLSVTWFRGSNLISGGDFGLPLDRFKYFNLMFFTWDETISTGFADYRQIASLIPYALWGAITQSLHLSIFFWEKSLFYFWFAGAGLSMYFLCSVLRMKRLGKLTASIFYMLNPFSLIVIWHVPHGFIQASYAFAPLLLAFYINGLQQKKDLKYIIFVCFISFLITTSAYVNPRATVTHWLLIFLYFLTAIFLQKKKRVFILRYTLKFFSVWLLFNLFWLLPFIFSIFESIESAHSTVIMNDLDTLRLTSVKIFGAIRMMGLWSLNSGYKGDSYYSYEAYYRLFPILLISWLIPVLVFLGFFHKEAKRKQKIFFFIFMIFFGLVGMSGAYLPLSWILLWPYEIFPPLTLLTRFTFLFFGIPTYLVFTVLLGYGVIVTKEWAQKKIGKVIFLPLTILFILLFVVLVWPFWNGEVIRSKGKIWPSERVNVPDYWGEAKKWLEEQKDFFRILPLPMSKTYNVSFAWPEGYSGGDPTRWFTSQPVINTNTGETFEIPALIGSLIEKEADFKDLDKLLGFLNVKYLFYREDTRWEYLRGHSWWFKHTPENIDSFISQQKDLNLAKEVGKLKFYQVKPEYLLPHIYVSQKIISVNGKIEGLTDIAPFLSPQNKETIIFSEQNEERDKQLNNQFNEVFIWQTPVFSTTGETDIVSLEEAVGRLPYVRFLPNSPFYIFIQLKESLRKLLSTLPNRVGMEIDFTNKRLKEVHSLLEKQTIPLVLGQKYLTKVENVQPAIKTLNHLSLEWQIINREIEKITDKKTKEELIKKVENQAFFQETFIRALKRDLAVDQQQSLFPAIAELEKFLESERKNFFEVNDLVTGTKEKLDYKKVIYKIEIPEDEQYEFYLRNDDFSKYYQFSNNLATFKVNEGKLQERAVVPTSDGSILLDSLFLNKGHNEITFYTPESLNLISDSSFEQGVWSGANPLPSSLKSEISAEQSTDAYQGKFSLKLSTTQGNAAVFVPIDNFRYGDVYKIQFAFKHLDGEPPIFVVWENDTKSSSPSLEFENVGPFGTGEPQTYFTVLNVLPSENNWRHYEFILKPQDATQALGLAFLAFQSKSGKTVNLFDDVKVERIFTNPILLGLSSDFPEKKAPALASKKINPARYELQISNATDPYFLVFSESFHPGWQISVQGEHLTVNGFANSWYIDRLGDYKIILEFKPQRIYYLSAGVSLLAFFSSLFYLWKKRKR